MDANAHLNMNQAAIKALIDFNNSSAAHGHPMSPSGRKAADAIENARCKIAELIGAESPNQIFFTTTCSQACEWAVFILSLISGREIYTAIPIEHPAVRQSIDSYFNREDIAQLNINDDGQVIFDRQVYSSVICIYAQNEIGTIQQVRNLNCEYLLSDTSQALGKIPFEVGNIDIAVFGAHKFGGPASVGFLYLKDTKWWSEFDAGSRYFMDRAGTPDAASIVATAAALEYAVQTLPERTQKMNEFRGVLEPGLKSLGCKVVGENVERLPNTTFVVLPKEKSMHVLLELSEHGIYCGLGSACGSIHTGSSPLMKKLGHNGSAYNYMRISNFGEYSKPEAAMFLDFLNKVLESDCDV